MKLAFLGVYPLVEVQEQCDNPFSSGRPHLRTESVYQNFRLDCSCESAI